MECYHHQMPYYIIASFCRRFHIRHQDSGAQKVLCQGLASAITNVLSKESDMNLVTVIIVSLKVRSS